MANNKFNNTRSSLGHANVRQLTCRWAGEAPAHRGRMSAQFRTLHEARPIKADRADAPLIRDGIYYPVPIV